MERIIEGEDPLSVAQDLGMTEKEVTVALSAALEVKTEFYQTNAASYQTLILQRLEDMYRDAKNAAFSDENGPNIHWFREMKDILQQIHKIIAPHLDQQKSNTVNIINPTILLGDDMYQRGKSLSSWKDKDVTDLIQGQLSEGPKSHE